MARLQKVQIIRSESPMRLPGQFCPIIDHPPKFVDVYIFLGERDRKLLPPNTRLQSKRLEELLGRYLDANHYQYVEMPGIPYQLCLRYDVHNRQPFGQSDPGAVAQIAIAKLQAVLEDLSRDAV